MAHFHEVRPIPEQAPGIGHLAKFANRWQPFADRHPRNLRCVTEKLWAGADRNRLRWPGSHGFESSTVFGRATDREIPEFCTKALGKRLQSIFSVLLGPTRDKHRDALGVGNSFSQQFQS